MKTREGRPREGCRAFFSIFARNETDQKATDQVHEQSLGNWKTEPAAISAHQEPHSSELERHSVNQYILAIDCGAYDVFGSVYTLIRKEAPDVTTQQLLKLTQLVQKRKQYLFVVSTTAIYHLNR